jgi:hypothetical protein
MKELTNLAIKYIPTFTDSFLEEITADWLQIGVDKTKDIVLPALILEKLKRYEREY